MATYFSGNGTEVHSADSLQTLYLTNPCYVGFPENVAAGNVVLMNQHDGNQFPGVHQQFVGIPLPATSRESFMGNQSADMNSGFMASDLRQHNHLWRNAGSELSFVPSVDQASPTDRNSSGSAFQIPTIEHSTSSGHQRLPEIPPPQHGLHRESQQGGLSLSLSSTSVQFMVSPYPFPSGAIAAAMVPPGAAAAVAVGSQAGGRDEGRVKWEGGLQSVLLGSKYLKAAQELLDELVSVGKGLKEKIATGKLPEKDERSKRESASTGLEDPVATKKGSELTVAERQELQTKKAKLITMLDEVDQRYKQYRHQVQSVVSSFEAATGAGAAKAYTELALQTISKQFRCLRDTISGQLRLTSRNLGEEVDCLGGGSKVEGSRLRSADRQLRQQRAMQQLGMLQHNAWRPQRGLPERAVSVLRAWLFEHFLHPYPKDADKHILAKQTGLTRSQVSNWFINARVRLWKPMVEEMYMEETKEPENEDIPDDKTCSLSEMNEDTAAAMKSTETDSPGQKMNMTNWNQMEYYTPTEPGASPPSISTAPIAMAGLVNLRSATMFCLNGSSSPDVQLLDESVLNQPNPKRITRNDVHLQDLAPFPTTMDVKPNPGMSFSGLIDMGDRQNRPGYAFSGGFSSYQLGDAGRYGHDMLVASGINTNCVSLTLGLPHCDSVLSLSGSQSPYLSTPNMHLGRRHELQLEEPTNDFCTLNPGVASAAATDAHSASGYENINIHSGKRFAAQLLPDFVT